MILTFEECFHKALHTRVWWFQHQAYMDAVTGVKPHTKAMYTPLIDMTPSDQLQ